MHVFGRIAKWLLLFIVVYKPSRTHVVIIVLSKLLNILEPLGVLDYTMDASIFFVEPIWM
jgi:hypothetical protein